eukprot:SAG22_NODE_1253_length_5001_cov_12.062220_5_plen_48_part_00
MRQEHLAAVPGHSKGKARVGPDAARRQAQAANRAAGYGGGGRRGRRR